MCHTVCSIFGVLATISSIVGLFPQIYKSFRTKSSEDVSMVMLINYLLGSLFWIVYGVCHGAFFVFLSNIIGFGCSAVAIFQKRFYDHKRNL